MHGHSTYVLSNHGLQISNLYEHLKFEIEYIFLDELAILFWQNEPKKGFGIKNPRKITRNARALRQ